MIDSLFVGGYLGTKVRGTFLTQRGAGPCPEHMPANCH